MLLLYAVLFMVVHLPLFPLREVKVNGELKHVTREQVQFIVTRALKGNFFTLDLNKTRHTFEKLPWVRSVNVRRRWPDRLEVTLEEHQVLARWGNAALVNTHGELFRGRLATRSLPVFNGPADGVEGSDRASTRFSGSNWQPIERQPVQVSLSPRRAWQLKLDNGLVVELGREKVEAATGEIRQGLRPYTGPVGQSKTVDYVDLRYPNGFRSASEVRPQQQKPAGA